MHHGYSRASTVAASATSISPTARAAADAVLMARASLCRSAVADGGAGRRRSGLEQRVGAAIAAVAAERGLALLVGGKATIARSRAGILGAPGIVDLGPARAGGCRREQGREGEGRQERSHGGVSRNGEGSALYTPPGWPLFRSRSAG